MTERTTATKVMTESAVDKTKTDFDRAEHQYKSALSRRKVFTGILGATGIGVLAGSCEKLDSETDYSTSPKKIVSGQNALSSDEIACVESIENLRSLPESSKKIAIVTGYWNHDDGGGGVFIWIENEIKPDDGGIIIAPTTGTGRWKRLFSDNFVNVKWFGAIADDSSASTRLINRSSIQHALDSIGDLNSQSSTLFFPRGFYEVDCENENSIKLPLKQGLKIRGTGCGDDDQNLKTTIRMYGVAPLFVPESTSNNSNSYSDNILRQCTIEDLTIVHGNSTCGHIMAHERISNGHTAFLEIHRVVFKLMNPHSSFLKLSEGPTHLKIHDMSGYMAEEASVPAIDIADEHGWVTFGLVIENAMIRPSGKITSQFDGTAIQRGAIE